MCAEKRNEGYCLLGENWNDNMECVYLCVSQNMTKSHFLNFQRLENNMTTFVLI